MVSKMLVIKYLTGILLILQIPVTAKSQTDTLLTVNLTDTSAVKGSKASLYTSAGYGNNMIYLGSTISQDQPYGYGSVILGFRDAVYATVSAVHLSNLNPFAAFYIGSINYSHAFNSWFDISANAYRYQVTPSLTDSLFSSFWYGDLTLGIDWRLLYTRITTGRIFSSDNETYLQVRNSRNFQTPEFTRGKVYFTFDPYINLLFGPLTRVETSSDTIIVSSYPFRQNGNRQGNGTTSGSYIQAVTNTDYSTDFGIMEIDFGLPVAFNSNRFTIEAEPGFVLPIYEDMNFPGLKGFVFTLTCYIKIF